MITTLQRYFGMRFLVTLLAVLFGVFALIILLDYVEQMRRMADVPNVSALTVANISLFRVPQIAERILPFCVLIGAMSCFLGLSRRLELVVSRAAGMSAWQFTAPAIVVALGIGIIATTVYNPIAAVLQEKAKRMEAEVSGNNTEGLQATVNGFWVSQRSDNGQSIINAAGSREQGVVLSKVSAFVFDQSNHFIERVESNSAVLQSGQWRLEDARVYAPGSPPVERPFYLLATNLTPEQVRETFSTPETVPFWQLPYYIEMAERAGLGAAAYRLQYQKLLSRPFMLAAMVLLAAAFSLRFFRMGGVQKMVLGGVASGFALYIMSKLTDDLSKAALLTPMIAAWMPAVVGAMTGFVALLYQEDG
ncbi:MAG: LPS export ABC transporter permease LptG [Alphaproteobacteria bacterium]|nr:LPS export ABC transporter permease LptG [Alphaproteobacteria bacterium]